MNVVPRWPWVNGYLPMAPPSSSRKTTLDGVVIQQQSAKDKQTTDAQFLKKKWRSPVDIRGSASLFL
jgi:hypothetical protein